MAWWLKGGVINLALAIPVVILAAKDDKTSAPPMIVMSVVLGTVIGVVGQSGFVIKLALSQGVTTGRTIRFMVHPACHLYPYILQTTVETPFMDLHTYHSHQTDSLFPDK